MNKIKGLYEINKTDEEKVVKTLLDAFSKYPKLDISFPSKDQKKAAVEATIRYYAVYDMHFGQAYSLDSEINECVCLLHSEDVDFAEIQFEKAGSYSTGFRNAMKRLGQEGQTRWKGLFDEIDKLEAQLSFPRPHLYVDILGVRSDFQRQGRGRKLMNAVCAFADQQKLPMMLFTNTPEDVIFYKSLGFAVTDVTRSDVYGFENTYLVREV